MLALSAFGLIEGGYSNRSSFALPFAAGWSSPVARQAHNLKVAGSNPAPAPKISKPRPASPAGLFAVWLAETAALRRVHPTATISTISATNVALRM